MKVKDKTKPVAKAFPGQHEGETVELVFHRHTVVMRKALIFGLLAILGGILPLDFWPDHYNGAIKFFLYVSLVVLAYWFYAWIGWYYIVYIVTNEPLVEIKHKGFFNHKGTAFWLYKDQ